MIDGGDLDDAAHRRCALRVRLRVTCVLLALPLGLIACGPADPVSETDSSTREEQAEPGPALRETAGRRYRVALEPRITPIPTGLHHDWVLRVENADGSEFAAKRLWVEGGLPAEGVTLLSPPRVSPPRAPGEFLVEGVNFHVGGDWVLRVELVGEAGRDRADFEVHVGS